MGYRVCSVNWAARQDLGDSHRRPGRPKDVRTTMIYTHVSNRGGRGVQSPLDRLRRK